MKHLLLVLLLLPVVSIAQVGNSYKDYLHSEFADFFHAGEIKRTPYKNGELREIKTGGFQDYITIYLYTDTVATIIHEATLEIDREWIDEDNGNDLARDLVKSFLLDFIPKADQPKAMAAGDLLFNHKTTKDQFALNLQDVFNKKKDSLSQQFSKSVVTTENLKIDNKPIFRM
ncbi:MAG TPA: hypothetical protein VGQ53_05540, partial [Chitinophagaceae bacterium]|nr:hypothetical protein [Chitinophagaceae bacterium]